MSYSKLEKFLLIIFIVYINNIAIFGKLTFIISNEELFDENKTFQEINLVIENLHQNEENEILFKDNSYTQNTSCMIEGHKIKIRLT